MDSYHSSHITNVLSSCFVATIGHDFLGRAETVVKQFSDRSKYHYFISLLYVVPETDYPNGEPGLRPQALEKCAMNVNFLILC